jgi:hypothetical protein
MCSRNLWFLTVLLDKNSSCGMIDRFSGMKKQRIDRKYHTLTFAKSDHMLYLFGLLQFLLID